MGKSINSGTRYGDVIAMHDITIILMLGGIAARGSIVLVESAVSDNNLDPGVRIAEVMGLARGTQISAVGLLYSCQLSEPEAGEVPVVHYDLGLRVGLSVGADVTLSWPLVSRMYILS